MRPRAASASYSADAELLFNALDDAKLDGVIACIERAPNCVNERDEDGRVALHYAAECTDVEITQRVLDTNPALVDTQDNDGFTPLFVAATSGNVEVLELLIARGAQLTHVDAKKHSAVHWAVLCAEVKTLECLLDHGAPFDTADSFSARPLHYATIIEDVSVERAETILHILLKAGANVNDGDENGRSPLIWAASNGNVEAFKSLIQAGANKFAVDNDRLGVLHCASYHGHVSILRTFLEQCGPPERIVNAKDRNGDTPLFFACIFGHYECAKLLLDSGVDANHIDKRCRSAAHCAAAKGQLRIMKLLKHYGASFQLQNQHGDLPFHEAVQTGSLNLVEWLLQLDGKFVSAANFYGRTPLHLAAAAGNMELTVLLCNRGSKINPLMLYRNELYTPLDLAKRRNHALIVEYLTQRHEAQTAAQISEEKQNMQRNSIQERLKTAKLRRVRAQLSSSSSDEDGSDGTGDGFCAARRRAMLKNGGAELVSGFSVDGRKYKIFRRHKSMLNQSIEVDGAATAAGDEGGGAEGELDGGDPEFFISRNVKSAPGIRAKSLSKSTSTTDLSMGESNSQQQLHQDGNNNNHDNNDTSALSLDETLLSRKDSNGLEHRLVESTIQKIVQEELRKAAAANEVTMTSVASDGGGRGATNGGTNISVHSTQDSMNSTSHNKKSSKRVKLIDVNMVTREAADRNKSSRPRRISPPMIKPHAYYYREDETATRRRRDVNGGRDDEQGEEDDDEDDEGENDEHALTITSHHYQTSRHRIRSGKKKRSGWRNPAAVPVQVTELHILEDGWQPSASENDAASIAAVERRYVHEKAIFEELTHLKRMQIQYGRVQERVLVRTLVANFCQMHGLNPAHFRHQTFHEWEKFLYDLLSDQLKMIYLEERDRIQPPGGPAAIGASASLPLGVRPSAIAPSLFHSGGTGLPPSHRSTARNTAAASGGSHLSILSSLASSSNRLHKASPLDERLRELTRIYSNSSVSVSAARYRRQASSLTRRAGNDNISKVPPLFLPKQSTKRLADATAPHGGAAPRHHNSDAENCGDATSGRAGGGKRCECLTRQQQQQQQNES